VVEEVKSEMIQDQASIGTNSAAGDETPLASAASSGNPGHSDISDRLTTILGKTIAEYIGHLQETFKQEPSRTTPRRRRRLQQRRQSELRDHIRRGSVEFFHFVQTRGGTCRQAAQYLFLSPRTLRQWDYDCRPELPAPVPLGRPPASADQADRQAVLDFIKDHGPGIGVPTLRTRFPALARAELTDLLRRYRRVVRDRYHTCERILCWQVAGRVWAIDFAEPSALAAELSLPPIDGIFPYLLAVRDLASGYQLAWLPVATMTAEEVIGALRVLFRQFGVPLLLKMDNGPAFRADTLAAFLRDAGVFSLFSPPHWPGYNGAIEAAIGSLKSRTANEAARHGRVDCWTPADVTAALAQANSAHPRRLHGDTPEQAWARRNPITPVERARFDLAVERNRYLARAEIAIALDVKLDHWENARLDRIAIQRALVEHDYLLFRGRRVPLIVQAGKVTHLV
jgi:transposase InsO family protein